MQITKEALLTDRQNLVSQRDGINATINYIDGLVAILAKPDVDVSTNPNEGA